MKHARAAVLAMALVACPGRAPTASGDAGFADAGFADAGFADAGFADGADGGHTNADAGADGGCPVYRDGDSQDLLARACIYEGAVSWSPTWRALAPHVRIVRGQVELSPFENVGVDVFDLTGLERIEMLPGAPYYFGGLIFEFHSHYDGPNAIFAPDLESVAALGNLVEADFPTAMWESAEFPRLSNVEREVVFVGNGALRVLDLHSLERAESIVITGNPHLERVDLSSLREAALIRVDRVPQLDRLTTVGRLRAEGVGPTEFTLPALTTARSVAFELTNTRRVVFPSLRTASQLFSVEGASVQEIDAPALLEVGALTISHTSLSNLAFPRLEGAQEVRLRDTGVEEIELPAVLQRLDALVVDQHDSLRNLSAPSVVSVDDLQIIDNPVLTVVNLPGLENAVRVTARGNAADMACTAVALDEQCQLR